MTVGKDVGETCDRVVGTFGNTRRCTGTITAQGAGVDETGLGYRWIGCTCGWIRRQQLPEPETIPLFGGDAA